MSNQKPIIFHIISSLKVGGAEQVLCSLIEHLDDYEHQVAYIHHGPMIENLRKLNIQTYQLSGFLHPYDLSLCFQLRNLIKKVQPVLIHSSLWLANMAGIVVGRTLGIPVIASLHNNLEQDGRLRNAISSFLLPKASSIISVSDEIARGFKAQFPHDQKKLVVIKNGIDISLIPSNKDKINRKSLGLDSHHFIIGSVGRLEPVKNYSFLIATVADLVKKYSHVRLVLLGTGSQEYQLKALVNQLGINEYVKFVGQQPARFYYGLFDCFTLSSNREGISMALLEAMANGVPCVITNESSSHDVITSEQDGLLVLAGNRKEFYKAFERLLLNLSLAQMLGSNAQKTVEENFAIHNMADAYRSHYKIWVGDIR